MPLKRRSLERFAVLVVIVATHVLFLEIFFRNGRQLIRLSAANAQRGELFFFELPPPQEEPSTSLPESGRERPAERPAASNAITVAQEERPPASIDWYGDAEHVARESLRESPDAGPRAFGEQPHSPYTGRKARKPGYLWQPEEKKAGFAGPLPYVRLGKRCIIVPPFFGCALGKLPRPGGATLEEIRDPDRPRESVPDVEE